MRKLLRQRPFCCALSATLYLLLGWPLAWLQGQNNQPNTPPVTAAPASPIPPQPANSEPLPPVPQTGLGPDVSVPPMKPGNVLRPPRNRIDQSDAEVRRKSAGCIDCHTTTDAHTM